MSNSMNILNCEVKRIDSTTLNAPTGNKTLTAAESGTHFLCAPHTAHRNVILPALSPENAGITYTFTKTSVTNAFNLVFLTGANIGTLIRGKSDGTLGTSLSGATSITMNAAARVGDFLKITNTGTNWVVVACSNSSTTTGFTSV